VTAARLLASPAASPPAVSVTDDDRRQTPTDNSEQNNTGPLYGSVIKMETKNAATDVDFTPATLYRLANLANYVMLYIKL